MKPSPQALPESQGGVSPVLQSSARCSFEPRSRRGWTRNCQPCAGFLAAASAQAGTPWPEGSSHPRRRWHSGRGPAGSEQTVFTRKVIKNLIKGKQSRGHSPSWTDPPEMLRARKSHVRAQEAMQTRDGRSPFNSHPTRNEHQCSHREGNSSPSETLPGGNCCFHGASSGGWGWGWGGRVE